MHRFGWFFIALGALMLFGRGGFFFLPLFLFWPLFMTLPLLFMGRRLGRGWGGHGPRSYHWRGRHGTYGQQAWVGCGPDRREPPAELRERQADRPEAYTGQTTRL